MVMLDRLESRQFLSAVLINGTLTITGTDAGERIYVEAAQDGRIRAAIDSTSLGLFKRDQVLRIVMDGRGGADQVINRLSASIPVTLLGGHGDDWLSGGEGTDFIHGGPGHDELSGNAGDDTIVGGSGDDTIWGGHGRDLINGSTGDDLSRSDGRDSIHFVETRQDEVHFQPIPGITMPLEIGLQQSGNSAVALLDFTFVDSGFRVDVQQVRRIGNQIRITVQVERADGALHMITEKRVTVPLGALPAGKYVVTVASADGSTAIGKGLTLGG